MLISLNRIRNFHLPLFALLVFAIALQSCREEDDFTNDASAKLAFSTDTLFFDTVFSALGGGTPLSVTKQLWVINPNAQGVKVNISLKGTANGSVRLNIDGFPANSLSGKEIRGNDSIVIFVQFYSNAGNDFIVTDQLLFETNGNLQDVDIVGFGRDAHYYRNQVIEVPGGNIVWQNDKPHVIYDSILIPQGQTLTIKAGTRIHSHRRSVILVQGTMIVEGEYSNPVIFEGDRMDADYRNQAGQWIGIRFLPRSKDNVIKHAIIKNAVIAVEVDSASVNANPNLLIRETLLDNITSAAIVGYSAHIRAINNVITNCGQFSFYGVLGGNYILHHNTIASYNFTFNRQNAHFVLDNSPYTDAGGNVISRFALNYELVNNIIYGSREDELIFNNAAQGEQSFTTRVIQNNLLRTKIIALNTNGNKLNVDPLFEDASKSDMRTKPESPAKLSGFGLGISLDISGATRNVNTPTIGAWE